MSNEQCNEPAAPLIPWRGESFACVLPKGHDGPHRPGGTCFKHGAYVGEAGVPPRCPRESEGCIPDDVKAEIAAQPTPAAVEKIEAVANTDRELWREREGDYYADSIHVTEGGGIGINCGGSVYVMPLRRWHHLVEETRTLLAENKRLVEEVTMKDATNLTLYQELSALHSRLASGEKEPPPTDCAYVAVDNEMVRTLSDGKAHGPVYVRIAKAEGTLLTLEFAQQSPAVPFVCPRCNGQGTVSTPPHIPGDARTFSTSSSAIYSCPVCRGSKLVTLSDANQVPHPSDTGET